MKVINKEYYVIQNEEGKFFVYDKSSGGYPYFSDSMECCEKYKTKQAAESFLYTSEYANRMFVKEFMTCVIRKVTITITLE